MSDEQQTGQEAAQSDGQQNTQDVGQANESEQQDQNASQADGQSTDTAAGQRVEDLPDWAQRVIRDARKEAGDARVAGKKAAEEAQEALTKSIGKALGLIKDDEKPDPAKLTEQLTAAQTETRLLKIERAAEKAARTHGADVDALLDSRAFAKSLGELDPTADDFAEKLDALVKTTVDANPKLKATQAAAASSVDSAGGSGEKTTGGNSVDDMRKQLRPSS